MIYKVIYTILIIVDSIILAMTDNEDITNKIFAILFIAFFSILMLIK